MKKILSLFLLVISFVIVNGQTFEIKYLNTKSINIGGKVLKVGDRFGGNDIIHWSSEKQAIKVLSDSNNVYVLSQNLAKKKNVKTFADFIFGTGTASVRDLARISEEEHREIFEKDFILLDSINISVGWNINEYSYFEATTTNLGENNFSFIIPSHTKKVLTINRDLFSRLPQEINNVTLSIKYIEKGYQDGTTEITDSMNIELVPDVINNE